MIPRRRPRRRAVLGTLFALGGTFARPRLLACALGLEVLGGRGGDDVDDEHLGIGDQRHAVGQRDRARGELRADRRRPRPTP